MLSLARCHPPDAGSLWRAVRQVVLTNPLPSLLSARGLPNISSRDKSNVFSKVSFRLAVHLVCIGKGDGHAVYFMDIHSAAPVDYSDGLHVTAQIAREARRDSLDLPEDELRARF